jgi:hypothetical protein
MEQGSYTLGNGAVVQAGVFQTNAAASYATTNFSQAFASAPVVVTSIGSFNNTYPVSGKVEGITPSSFNYRMDTAGSGATTPPATETIDYIAWQPSSGTVGGLAYNVGITPDLSSDALKTIAYGQSFLTVPEFIADLQAFDDSLTSTLRWVTRDATGVNVEIYQQNAAGQTVESQSGKSTGGEIVGFILLAPAK